MGQIPLHFGKGDIVCDILYVFVHTKPLLIETKFFPLTVDPISEALSPLKMYPFLSSLKWM